MMYTIRSIQNCELRVLKKSKIFSRIRCDTRVTSPIGRVLSMLPRSIALRTKNWTSRPKLSLREILYENQEYFIYTDLNTI